MTPQVVSIGDLVTDLIVEVRLPIQPFQHQEGRDLLIEPGGACNFILAARRLGLRVSAVAVLGADLFGDHILSIFETEGVETSGIFRAPGSHSALVLDLIDVTRHEHVFIGNHGHGEPAPYTPAADAIVASAEAVFVQGYTLMEQQMGALTQAAVERARLNGIPVYFDVGPTVRHVPFDQVRWTVERTTVLMMTEDEVALATNGVTGEAAYDHLLSLGPQTLVVKQGPAGCSIIRRDGREQVPGFVVPVKDTVGAGDCFDAAFIYGQLQGLNLRQCGLLANAMGAACVQKLGAGRNVPTRAEVETVLREAGIPIEL